MSQLKEMSDSPDRESVVSRKSNKEVLETTEIDTEEPYDPFAHRNVPKPTSDFGALAHILKTSLGSGILAMPMAFKNSGLVFGTFGTVTLGIICTHCVQMLISCSQTLCKRKREPIMTYARTAEAAFETGPHQGRKFAKFAGILINIELIGSFLLGNSVYVVFMAQTMFQVCEFYWKPGISVRLYVLMLWIPLIIMCLFRNLKSLVPFSVLANIFVLVSFSITLYYIFRDIQPTDSVNLIAPIQRLPLFLCTVVFAIEGIGSVLSIENEMKHPQNFLGVGCRCGILYIAMTIVIIVYTVIGFFGYLQYGEDTLGSITLNLPIGDTMGQVVKILIGLAIFFTYALQFYVPIQLIWSMIKPKIKEKYWTLGDLCVRVGMVTFTIITAIAVPNLEPIISLVGAICFSSLGLLLPSLIDTITRWPMMGKLKWRLIKNCIIMTISIMALTAGTYVSMLSIIGEYFEHVEQ